MTRPVAEAQTTGPDPAASSRLSREGRAYLGASRVVVAITLLIGLGEGLGGTLIGSAFLTKDGLEWGYGLLIYVIGLVTYGRSQSVNMWGGFLSAAVLAAGGIQGAVELTANLLRTEPEDSLPNLAISAVLSILGSGVIAALLVRFRRATDPVVSASWLSARNDIVTNTLDAAVTLGSRWTGMRWLDACSTAIGVALAFSASYAVAREATALRAGTVPDEPR